jgi:hypothetical protein
MCSRTGSMHPSQSVTGNNLTLEITQSNSTKSGVAHAYSSSAMHISAQSEAQPCPFATDLFSQTQFFPRYLFRLSSESCSRQPQYRLRSPHRHAHSFGCFNLGHTHYVQAIGTSASAPLASKKAAFLRAAIQTGPPHIVAVRRNSAVPTPPWPACALD